MAKFGQGYNMREKPSRGEELDQRFGAMVVKMRRGVEAFQANDRKHADEIRGELDKEIKALDDKVQRELAGYVRGLVLDEIVPAATLHYAGPIGRSYQRLAKLALAAKLSGFTVDSNRFRDSIVAIVEGKENERVVKAFVESGRFEKARAIKTGAFAAEIRKAAPKSWFEPRHASEPRVTNESLGLPADIPQVEDPPVAANSVDPALSDEEMDRIATKQAALAATKTGTRRSRKWSR